MEATITDAMIYKEGYSVMVRRAWNLRQRGFSLTVPYDFYYIHYAGLLGLWSMKHERLALPPVWDETR